MSQSFLQAKSPSSSVFSSASKPQPPNLQRNSTDVFSQLNNFRNETLRRAQNSERSSLIQLESPIASNINKQAALNIGSSQPPQNKHSFQPITPQNLASLQIQQLSPKKTFLAPQSSANYSESRSSSSLKQQTDNNIRSSQLTASTSSNFSSVGTASNSNYNTSFLQGQSGVLGTISSNLSNLQKEIKELGSQKLLANSVSAVSLRKSSIPTLSSYNAKRNTNYPEAPAEQSNQPQKQLFSYSPDKNVEVIYSPERMAVRLNSLPNTRFTDFVCPKTTKLGSTRIVTNSTAAVSSSKNVAPKRSISQCDVQIKGLDELRIQIQNAGRANQQKGQLNNGLSSVPSNSQSTQQKPKGVQDYLLTDIADLTRHLNLFSAKSKPAPKIFKAK